MTGLDTNIIVRFIMQDDSIQSPIATRLFESFSPDAPAYISAIALIETVWVLRSTYDANREHIQRVLDILLRSRGVMVERSDLVWMALRAHGWRTIRAAVKSNIDLTRMLEVLLAERGFRVLEGGELSVACARWEPRDQTQEAIDRLQNTIARDVVSSGKAWFSTTHHADRIWLRFNMVNLHTREHHVRQLADILRTAAERATSKESK